MTWPTKAALDSKLGFGCDEVKTTLPRVSQPAKLMLLKKRARKTGRKSTYRCPILTNSGLSNKHQQQTEKPPFSTREGAFFIVARDRIELPTHGFSVHCFPVVKYKKGQENGAGI